MKRNELIKEITDILDNAVFSYKGELYDKKFNCIGYLPDLAYWVSKYLGYDDDECDDLTNYIQIDIFDMFCKVYSDEDTLHSRYLRHVKRLLLNLI